MIKINVILNNIRWKSYLKNPNIYIKKIKNINKKNSILKKIFFIALYYFRVKGNQKTK